MSEPMSPERLAEIRARAEAATPGPWFWDGNTDSRHLRLATPHGMSMTIVDFVRWGMHGAQPRFGIDGMMHDGSGLVEYEVAKWSKDIYRRDVNGIDHPDARFIAAARADVDDLLAEVDRLRAERNALRQQLEADSDYYALQRDELEHRREQMRIVEAFCAERAESITAINNCHPENRHDYWRWQGHAEKQRQLSERLGLPIAWPPGYEDGAS